MGARVGCATVRLESTQLLVPASHAVWIPPRALHGVRSHGRVAGWSVYVAAAACAALPTAPCTLVVTPLLRETVYRAAT